MLPSVEALVPAWMRVKASGMRSMPSPAENRKEGAEQDQDAADQLRHASLPRIPVLRIA